MNERLLIVEDEETLCESLKRVLSREGYLVDTAYSAEAALEFLERGLYDLIITDIILPGITGIELLKILKERLPEQIVILTTAYASLETAVEALRTGAYDYVVKPVMHEEIKQIVKNALTQGMLQQENIRLRRHIERQYNIGMIIGESPAMRKMISGIKEIAEAGKNVLLRGEIGTGKELIARTIHCNSSRACRPFVPVTLYGVPEELLEATLFGYMKGSLSNALTSQKGLLEEANGGTLFLRELGDLDAGLQEKLVRALADRGITPVGGKQRIEVDLRIVSATTRDIESAVQQGRFRSDFFEKINGLSIELLPLRDRKEDIELLAAHFIRKYAQELCKAVTGMQREAMKALLDYDWPGNVRELQNVIERAVLISEDETIGMRHLPQLSLPQ